MDSQISPSALENKRDGFGSKLGVGIVLLVLSFLATINVVAWGQLVFAFILLIGADRYIGKAIAISQGKSRKMTANIIRIFVVFAVLRMLYVALIIVST